LVSTVATAGVGRAEVGDAQGEGALREGDRLVELAEECR
jgi:hypothetical protein